MLQCNVEAEDGTIHVEDSLLSVAPLQCIDNYKLEEEDPLVMGMTLLTSGPQGESGQTNPFQ